MKTLQAASLATFSILLNAILIAIFIVAPFYFIVLKWPCNI